ncbi:hypothetical protein O6H91_03G015700 [Diphasiastrum complanatum]|uniref:Uncharacterized protein n=1 Tax=Diphasiastrum complanatum TaxID=34168 RepID=A0ACC2E3R4_DIPCM|nr:hypothetical protein O6H91_03G015700 [Diphasiastrum complanatum]
MQYVGHTVNGPVKLIPSPLPQAPDRFQLVDQTTWRQQLHTIVLRQQDETECEMEVRIVRRKKVIPGRVQLRTLERLAYAVQELVNEAHRAPLAINESQNRVDGAHDVHELLHIHPERLREEDLVEAKPYGVVDRSMAVNSAEVAMCRNSPLSLCSCSSMMNW